MISTKDQFQHDNIPNVMPLAYALKGNSISTKEVWELVNIMKNKLAENGIPVLVYCYDGQWKNLVCFDNDGESLTWLQVNIKTWSKISKMSIDHIFQELSTVGGVCQANKYMLSSSAKLTGDMAITGNNIKVYLDSNGHLTCNSLGGGIFPVPVVSLLHLQQHDEENDKDDQISDESGDVNPEKKTKKKQVGLTENEENLLSLLDDEFLQEIEDICEPAEGELDLQDEDVLPDLQVKPTTLEKVLNSKEFALIEAIVTDLHEFNSKKWENLTLDELFPCILQDVSALHSACTIKNLVVIANILKHFTGRAWYSYKFNKARAVNKIAEAFDCKNFLQEWSNEAKSYTPKSLIAYLVSTYLKENATQVQLQVSYAATLHGVEKHKWEMRCPINMKLLIPGFGDSTIDVVDSFSYLQYSHSRKLVEFATLDYTHILTNMRGHILKNGYDFCKREHFREIADDKPDLLSSAFVYDIIDQQCAAKALQMFSLEVETYLKDRGHHESAEFVHLVWCWHAACDQCGTCADYRVASLYEM